ncbi:ABC transporter substrate-binding protein [Plastorhodobacter daqingensis]|uniref:ABC transporter substrate-binding protein n=1 Tax=Plastorhodobacter daqingensis TaxID=1387281 RepID=A0ABW2UHZ3_9RHOB
MQKLHLWGGIAALALAAGPVLASEMRIGLNEDPDSLDPAQSRTFVSSLVYEQLCDRLFNVNEDMEIIPELATDWDWSEDGMSLVITLRDDVVHHDGTEMTGETVRAVLERNMTLPESSRKSELSSIERVEATGPHEVTIHLTAPDVTLVAHLSHHAGRIYSPTAAEAAGAGFSSNPVCTGPYRFVQRVAQDRIVLEKFEDHWDADNYHLDRVIYMPIPDTTVRLSNLRAGDLDMVERVAPPDVPTVQSDSRLKFFEVPNIGYQGMTFNVGNGPRSEEPLGADPRVRKALSLAIDREVLNQVVFEGLYVPGNQWAAPGTTWYNENDPVPARDVDAARALLNEAGIDRLAFELTTGNAPVAMQAGQVIQAMAAEAGFDITLRVTEFATLLSENAAGNFQASLQGWSGRIDPDANIHVFVSCQGGNNDGRYCNEEVDAILAEARTVADPEERKALYDRSQEILAEELPLLYLYHIKYLYAARESVEGFTPYADGVIRLAGVTNNR